MEDNVLLRFLQSLTGGNNSPEQVPSEDGAQVSQDAPQEQIDPASLGKYEQPYKELVASGMPPQEAYDTIMAQVEKDRSAYSEYAPKQENSGFNVYGRIN